MTSTSDSLSETILIAEDEADLLSLYEIWLGDRWSLRLATDGNEAIRLFDEGVSIALLDKRMPLRSGEDVAQHIRDQSSCPIAMISADVPSPRILSLPLDMYLCKPIRREDFQRVVDQLIALRCFDECVREYFSLTARLSTLHEKHSVVELKTDTEYRRACERIDELSACAKGALTELDDQNPAFASLFREFTR